MILPEPANRRKPVIACRGGACPAPTGQPHAIKHGTCLEEGLHAGGWSGLAGRGWRQERAKQFFPISIVATATKQESPAGHALQRPGIMRARTRRPRNERFTSAGTPQMIEYLNATSASRPSLQETSCNTFLVTKSNQPSGFRDCQAIRGFRSPCASPKGTDEPFFFSQDGMQFSRGIAFEVDWRERKTLFQRFILSPQRIWRLSPDEQYVA